MRKIFTFLLALAASVGMMNAKVTWNSSNIDELTVAGTSLSFSMEGVTLSANANDIFAEWDGHGDDDYAGIYFYLDETGGYTFSNTLGKNFTKIEMTLIGSMGWADVNLGSGWSFLGEPYGDGPFTVTWKGNASTVDLLKDEYEFDGAEALVHSIVFYFEGDSDEPDPATPAEGTTTVTWDSNTLSRIYLYGGEAFPEGGVTLTALEGEGEIYETSWQGYSDDASFKFSTSLGNFTRIEITGTIYELGGSGWTETSPGAVWTGNANETTFGKYFDNVSQIVFTIKEPAPAPATPKAYNSGTVALKDLIVGDTLMAGVTLTDDADKDVFFVENRFAMNGSIGSDGGLFNQFISMLASPLLGDNASFSLWGMTVTPINEEGNAGNAWVVVEGYTEPVAVYLAGIGSSESEPTGVENVQTNHVQATKFFRDGMLLIEKNGKTYNVMGAEVK